MKTFLVLCLLALASTTGWSVNERVSSMPTGVQRQKTRRVFLLPRTGRIDINRLFYLKHLLELNCLRHICNKGNCKGSRCPVYSNAVKSDDRNQHDQIYYTRMRENRYRERPPYRRRYPSDDRMIVIPPNFYFINPRVENLSRLTSTGKNQQGPNLLNQNTDNVIYIEFPPQNGEGRTLEDQFVGDETNFDDSQDIQTSSHDKTYWEEAPPNHGQQYEVEEIVDEEPYQRREPFLVIKKTTEEALEELKNDTTNRNNSIPGKENVKNYSNHRSRELVNDKLAQIQQEETKYGKITPPVGSGHNRGQIANPNTNRTGPPVQKPKTEKPSLSFDLFDSFLTNEPEKTKNRKTTVSYSEIQTTAKVSKGLKELITTKPDWSFPEDSNTSPTMLFKTVEYFSEATVNKADMTTPHFKEYTDHPLLFDLFPKVKPKDPEPVWKNSRKMHFPLENQEEQRRSDILINDDYYDYENTFSTSNYLEKLRENSSSLSVVLPRNLSADAIIPLIPAVINDLREDKIAEENFPILSETFGKYWQIVLALSNSTNLDMLPLLKMKNEEDLENVLRTFLPETSEQTTTTTTTTTEKTETEFSKNLYYDLYDYDIDNYKDLYKDITEIQDVSPNDKRKRFGTDSVK